MDEIVYFAGAIRGDRIVVDIMGELIDFIKGLGVPVLSEHIIKNGPDDRPVEEIEEEDMGWIERSTHLIAEVSGASTGTGIEIGHARRDTNKKVLCIYQRERQYLVSAMVRGMGQNKYPNVIVKAYSTIEEAKLIVKEFLSK